MNYLNAAIRVLAEAASPLTSREIVDEAIRRGLVEPKGKTPEATMSARLYTYLQREPSSRIGRAYQPGQGRAGRNSVRCFLE